MISPGALRRWRHGRMELLTRLGRVEPESAALEEEERFLQQMRLTPNLLLLAAIDHEQEHELCRSVAQHLLGWVPELHRPDLRRKGMRP